MIVDVAVHHAGWSKIDDVEALAVSIAQATCRTAETRLAADTELSILLTDDEEICGLNQRYRGQDKATNVLSFPQSAGTPGPLLGDVVLAFETVEREAAEQGKTFEDHAAHLLVHGMLHLLGYDHMNEIEADAMENLERRILAGLGIGDPYAAPLMQDRVADGAA